MLTRNHVVLAVVVAAWSSCSSHVMADELRVVDRSGLVRAVRSVKGEGTIVIQLSPEAARITADCVLLNVDGTTTERRAPVDSQGRCVVRQAAATTWQIDTPSSGRYQVQIDVK
jgi:hypothetical protein